MKVQTPQISWHGRDAVLSVDFQVINGEIRRLATGGIDAHVVVWYYNLGEKNIVTIECACDINRHTKSVNIVRFAPNGEYLASGDDEGAIFIWRLRETFLPKLDGEEDSSNKEEWSVFKVLRGHIDDICDLCWSPDSGYLMSGSIDNSAIIWDIQKGQNTRISREAKSFVQGVAWDPLNQCQATISSDRMLRIYNSSNGKVVHRIHKASWLESSNKGSKKLSKLFHDDTLQSYCRRLKFTHDGELLFVPSGIKEKGDSFVHTTYVFSRHEFTRPILNLPSGQKYTLAVCCCPVLFKLQGDENQKRKPMIDLPYRTLFAVATQDSILMYDTQQLMPFGYVANIHYRHLTDLSWSPDGRMLIVSSTDGYCSFIIFNEGELGEIYVPEKLSPISSTPSFASSPKAVKTNSITSSPKSVRVDSFVSSPKVAKPESFSPPEKDDNMDAAKDVSTPNRTGKLPNPNKSKTPKGVSSKKTPKTISIKQFFSTSDKSKVRIIDNSDDCVIVDEKREGKRKCEIPLLVVTNTDDHDFKTDPVLSKERSVAEKSTASNCVSTFKKELFKPTDEDINRNTTSDSNELDVRAIDNKIDVSDDSEGRNNTFSSKGRLSPDSKKLKMLTPVASGDKADLDLVEKMDDGESELAISKDESVPMEEDIVVKNSFHCHSKSVPCSEADATVSCHSLGLAEINVAADSSSSSFRDVEIVDAGTSSKCTNVKFDGIAPLLKPVLVNTPQLQALVNNKPKKRIQFITLSSNTISK